MKLNAKVRASNTWYFVWLAIGLIISAAITIAESLFLS